MKTYSLSDPKERLGGILFSIVITIAMIAMLVALRHDIVILLMALLASALLIFFLGLYALNVTKAACIYDPETKTMEVKGLSNYTLDLSEAVMLETFPIRAGHASYRMLVFTNAEGGLVGKIPTMFTSRQGIMTEPFAKAMAEDLGLQFRANVPVWEYDEEARKEHEKEVAIQEKEERKARSKARGQWMIQRYKNRFQK